MRTAVILALGFLAVFVVSLIAAPGSDSPPRSTTRSCGPYAGSAARPRYVAYATKLDCARALRVARAYVATHVCHRGSDCKAVVDGLDCQSAGAAARALAWMGCGRGKHILKPRVFFSVDRPGASAEAPDAPALPS